MLILFLYGNGTEQKNYRFFMYGNKWSIILTHQRRSNRDAPTKVPIVKNVTTAQISTVFAFIAKVLACNDSTKLETPVLFLPDINTAVFSTFSNRFFRAVSSFFNVTMSLPPDVYD